MIKSINFALALIFMGAFALKAQNLKVFGKVIDKSTNEALVGAVIAIDNGKGTVTDIDGNYAIILDAGSYVITCNYVGYLGQKQKINLTKNSEVNFAIENKTLDEVEVIADVAKIRETPVAVSNISITKIQEELAGRDISMIANTTPGVYASESGGGSGDSRLTIRGVDQRNIAVMVDGVPVNDMETGAVFWSNWDGLGEVTKNIQIQRGLGASKLAIPSLGGTMNIITKGIDQKESFTFKYEMGTRNQTRVALGYSNSFFNKKLGLTMAATRKSGSAFPQGTYTDAWSYFFKLQYRPHPKHLIGFGFNGAPQEHGQRLNGLSITKYDTNYAKKIGVDLDSAEKISTNTIKYSNYGKDYNPGWGNLKGDQYVTRRNYYHKPLFNLNYTYSISSRFTLSSLLYASFGNGGGTTIVGAGLNADERQFDFDKLYNANRKFSAFNSFKFYTSELLASTALTSNVNNHKWYGGLISATGKISNSLSVLAGIDARYYIGEHYRQVYETLGADFLLDNNPSSNNRNVFSNDGLGNFPALANKREAYQSLLRRKGDKIGFYYDGFVKWGGAFGQVEYKKNNLSAFLTGSYSITEYQRVDYFAARDVKINGEWQEQLLGYGDTAYAYNGEIKVFKSNLQKFNSNSFSSSYTIKNGQIFFKTNGKLDSIDINAEKYTIQSENTRSSTSEKKTYPGYTIKTGANYNLNDENNVFANVGYLTIAPRFNNVYRNNNSVFGSAQIQQIYAMDLGYSYRSKLFAANINGYYTDWKNRPSNAITTDTTISILNGVHVELQGVELDFNSNINKYLELEGSFSYGNWIYKENATAFITDINNVPLRESTIYAKNVHVGDAAQTTYNIAARFRPIKGLSIKPRVSFFQRHYAAIDPSVISNESLQGKDSWKIPNYYLIDLNLAYEFPVDKVKFSVFANVNNLLDKTYITDGFNGSNYDVYTSTVYIGAGRRFNLGIRISL
jgi:iron complex outermembrane recepter protein